MRIFVKAKPSSKTESVKKLDDENFIISVKEPPYEGRASNAIIRALAEHFGVSPSQIRLVSGFTSKQKIFEIE